MKENLYIDLNEDIQSIIARIQEAEAESLDLVVPTGARVLQNIVDAHLLKEAGTENGKNITIVTNDLMGKIFAERAGLVVSTQPLYNNDEIVAGQAVSTGRISDIVSRKKIDSLPPRYSTASLAAARSATRALPAKPISSKKKQSVLNMDTNTKKKGEIGAGFLKSYRQERSQASVFNELSRINKRKIKWPFRLSTFSFIWLVVGVALVTAFIVFSTVLPRADIIIHPVREPKTMSVDIMVSSSAIKADLNKGIIPGELLTLDKTLSADFSATGASSSSQKATGKITIYNAYSAQAQSFIASRFQAETGQIFWTTKPISIPGYTTKGGKTVPGQVTVSVAAAEGGETYNIGPSKFTMPGLKNSPKYAKIYAVSDSPMSGGGSGSSKIVSNDDAGKAYGALKQKIEPELAQLKQNLPSGFQFWPEAYNEELADSSVVPEVAQSATTFKANVKMTARAVVFKSNDLNSYIDNQLLNVLDSGKSLVADTKEITFLKPPVVDYQKGSILATLQVKYDVADKLDSDSFKNAVLKKNKKDIQKIMEGYKNNIERVEVNLWPFWVSTVPANPDRVTIKISSS